MKKKYNWLLYTIGHIGDEVLVREGGPYELDPENPYVKYALELGYLVECGEAERKAEGGAPDVKDEKKRAAPRDKSLNGANATEGDVK